MVAAALHPLRRGFCALAPFLLAAAGCADSTGEQPLVVSEPATTAGSAQADSTIPPSTVARTTAAPTTVEPIGFQPEPFERSAVATAATAETAATRVSVPTTTPYVVPIAQPDLAGWNPTHSTYPATDIFVVGGCGATIVSPVNGEVLEVRTIDAWSPEVDDPATRGGRSVAIRGDDGVRYYLAHFATIAEGLGVGQRILAGLPLGTVGDTGRASACHVHFGISPPCPRPEWSVRRGVVWPHPYLDAWKAGRPLSPAAEIADWLASNPTACAVAAG